MHSVFEVKIEATDSCKRKMERGHCDCIEDLSNYGTSPPNHSVIRLIGVYEFQTQRSDKLDPKTQKVSVFWPKNRRLTDRTTGRLYFLFEAKYHM
jgi:hypothetical protein